MLIKNTRQDTWHFEVTSGLRVSSSARLPRLKGPGWTWTELSCHFPLLLSCVVGPSPKAPLVVNDSSVASASSPCLITVQAKPPLSLISLAVETRGFLWGLSEPRKPEMISFRLIKSVRKNFYWPVNLPDKLLTSPPYQRFLVGSIIWHGASRSLVGRQCGTPAHPTVQADST